MFPNLIKSDKSIVRLELLGFLFNEVFDRIDSDVLTVSQMLFGNWIEPDKS